MYPILALQAAAMGLALFVSCPDRPVATVRAEPQPAVRTPAPSETPRMRCRLYFGCMPTMIDSKPGYSQ
jgi:hypothetical protein